MAFSIVGYGTAFNVGSGVATVTAPAGIQANDLLIAFISYYGSTSAPASSPSFVNNGGQLSSDATWGFWNYERVATASEPSSYSFGSSSDTEFTRVTLIVLRGAATTSYLNASASVQDGTTGSGVTAVSVGPVTTTVADCALLLGAIGVTGNNSMPAPSGWTGIDTTAGGVDVSWTTQSASGSTGTITDTGSGADEWLMWLIAIAPAVAPTVALSGVATDSGTLAGALTPPAVTLAGVAAESGTLAGTLTAVSVALSGLVTLSGALAGTLTPPPVTLAGESANSGALAGTLTTPNVTLVGVSVAVGALSGALTTGLRPDNEIFTVSNVLSALAVILPQATQLALVQGSVLINDDSSLLLDTARWPALLIEQGPQAHKRIAPRTWQKQLTFTALYLARWDADSGVALDAIWDAIAQDVERMIANLTDNPTLTAILPGTTGATRTCLSIADIEPSPRTTKVVSDDYGPKTVERLVTIKVNMPPYISAG